MMAGITCASIIIIIITIIIIIIIIMIMRMMMIIIIIVMMTMMMMMMMMMIMIIIALKGAIRDFDNLLTAPRTVSNPYAQVARPQSGANHVQHIERFITCNVQRVTWYEGTAKLLSLTELKSHLFELYFIACNR